jgi:hydrogenase maturation protease
MPNSILVIGIGNEYAHDDAAGLHVARILKEQTRPEVKVLESSGEGAALIELWKGFASVVVVDAVRSTAAAGTVCRFEVGKAPLPAEPFQTSTHAFGLYEAVELARSLGQLPQRLIVFGIEGDDFSAGLGLSPVVARAVNTVARAVLVEARTGKKNRSFRAR